MHYEEHSALVKEGHLLGFANLESLTSVQSIFKSAQKVDIQNGDFRTLPKTIGSKKKLPHPTVPKSFIPK